MSDATDPRVWAEYAEEDYAMARMALRRKQPLTHSACFHAQQCAEKYLKALLVAKGEIFPKTHDLVTLNNLCTRAGILLGVDSAQLHTLSLYAVQARYPDEELILDEAKEALETTKAVRRFARQLLGLK